MVCRTFFQFTQTGESVSSANPQDLSPSQVWSELVQHIADGDDYVGLLDADDNVLQISRELPDAPYLVEVVMTDSRDSYVGLLQPDQMKGLLERLPSRFKAAAFPDFERRAWNASNG